MMFPFPFFLTKRSEASARVCVFLIAALLAGIVFGLTPVRAARADTYTVCATGCDFVTIQAAINDVGVSAGDVINVMDGVHTEVGITVGKDVTIQGQGADGTIVQAHAEPESAEDRVFLVPAGATVTIKDMTIRHGNPISEPESGGGVRNEGTLTLENVVLRDNYGSAGGAILNDGTMMLVNCAIRDNVARGGSYNYIECSTGGGIKNMVGTMTLINSTVNGNTSEAKGGGIHVACHGTLVLINSTISGNTASANGGGVYVDGVGEFTNSTIAENTAQSGGGVYVDGSPERNVAWGVLNYTNTIVASNSATFEKYGVADCVIGDYASIGANVNNLVGDGASCAAAHSGEPLLGALADDGSGVHVHALLPGSPAVDAIPAGACVVTADQRGVVRPQGKGCDVGAFELERMEGGGTAAGRVGYGGLLLGLLILVGVGGWVVVRRLRRG
jgi:hypothetical protein